MKKNIIINSGHWGNSTAGDPGAIVEGFIERDENMKIRDAVVPLLKAEGFEVIVVPDSLNLKASIAFVNQNAKSLEDGLALDIHLNKDSGILGGAEVYFFAGSQKSKDKAEVLSRNIAQTIGVPNRGARPDTSSFVGSLGWVRYVNCWSFVIEVLYLDNALGAVSILIRNKQYDLIARGICNGVKELFGMTELSPAPQDEEEVKKGLLQRIIKLYQQIISFIIKRK